MRTSSSDDRMQLAAGAIAALAALAFVTPCPASDLTFVEMHQSGAGAVTDLEHPNECAVSPDGADVYVASNASHSVVHFVRDPATGGLTFVTAYVDGVGGVDGLVNCASVAVSPDGETVYTAAQGDDAIAVFDRDPATGALTWLESHADGVAGVDGLDRVIHVMVSPDGAHVYAAAINDDAVAVFSRDAVTGRLTFVEAQVNNTGGVSGLNSPGGLAMDSQGEHLYVSATWSHAVTMFSRDAVTGALTFVDSFTVSGLSGCVWVAITPDDGSVLASSMVGDALVVFDRDPVSGVLTHASTYTDGVGGVTHIAEPLGLVVDPGGMFVSMLGQDADAVATFRRDPVGGGLVFAGAEIDGVDGVDGLAGPNTGCIDADGRSLYVAAWDDDAISVFHPALLADGFESGGTTRWSDASP